MEIDFYSTFTKRVNSTKRPANNTANKTLTGYLKEPCSILNPTIKIERLPSDACPEVYTYAMIPSFQRWYFVKDWTWADGLWEVTMEVDVLGTWRTYIGSSSEYILRTDNNTTDFDGSITDKMYPATTDFVIQQTAFTNPFETIVADGCYVVGIINGDDTNAVGAITYYAMTSSEFGELKKMLFGTGGLESMGLIDPTDHTTWLSTDVSEEFFKTMYNPYQYIASCMWFPIPKTSITGSQIDHIRIGWWNYSISGKRLTQQIGSFHDSVEQMPSHPQAALRGKYLNYAPYTKMTLYGKFGSIPIDTSFLEVGSYLVNMYSVDYVSGQCLFQVFVADNALGTGRKLLAKTEFLIGVPIQLAQIGRDYLGTAVSAIDTVKSSVIGAAAGLIAGGGIAGAVGGALISGAHGIYDTINTSMPQLETSGVNGSFIGNELSTILISIFFKIVDENITHKGRPLCQVRRIDTLSGFIQCAESDIDIPCFLEEKNRIGAFYVNGFFWE